ncbi:hypothetical protein PACTADRAFT_51395 [Pachysolen tannophilus NRRL Y-2460]|uniref:mannan endo-1,6-alpha-mannosidase n=1 Tax=Pachysolen tannophilus NRRL Y-2460 TaxID=669874 RepID=A0A1E4TPE8_PACTA|nr:hypothetical protein PACTADRAFT_51395 [Pachysolen tannophilus NRRL Y-2460]
MLDNWFFLQNDTYVDTIKEALLYQVGDDWDYIPLNQSTTEGNDDQVFWGIAVMAATERNFTNPSSDEPQWLYLAQAVFNTMSARWDTANCDGGLRWQIFQWNAGYDYKNSVSNAGLFHLGARLARYTSNDTYVEWCEKVYDWLIGVGFIVESPSWFIYDGASITDNCSVITELQWTYTAAMMMSGCAYLYNYTEDEIWLTRTDNFLQGTAVFLNNSVIYEAACQTSGTCNTDQRSFKALLVRAYGLTMKLVPSLYTTIMPIIETSAKAAAQSCVGGYDGHTCGLDWSYNGWDGYYGLGEQMCALEVIQNLLTPERPAPYTATDGGSSIGNGAAGTQSTDEVEEPLTLDAGDRAGAGIITVVVGVSIITTGVWLVM